MPKNIQGAAPAPSTSATGQTESGSLMQLPMKSALWRQSVTTLFVSSFSPVGDSDFLRGINFHSRLARQVSIANRKMLMPMIYMYVPKYFQLPFIRNTLSPSCK